MICVLDESIQGSGGILDMWFSNYRGFSDSEESPFCMTTNRAPHELINLGGSKYKPQILSAILSFWFLGKLEVLISVNNNINSVLSAVLVSVNKSTKITLPYEWSYNITYVTLLQIYINFHNKSIIHTSSFTFAF